MEENYGTYLRRRRQKVYRDGDRLIKSFDETYSKADILNEALNQARVEQTSLNIPKILGVSVVDGKWSVIWEFIEGETLEKMMQDHPEKRMSISTSSSICRSG